MSDIVPSANLVALIPVGIESLVFDKAPTKTLVIASLDNEPESHVTLTVVFVEKDDELIVPKIVPGVAAINFILLPACR